ncbi:hypothetical protein ACSBR2_003827 [Camellia fascicularis]
MTRGIRILSSHPWSSTVQETKEKAEPRDNEEEMQRMADSSDSSGDATAARRDCSDDEKVKKFTLDGTEPRES